MGGLVLTPSNDNINLSCHAVLVIHTLMKNSDITGEFLICIFALFISTSLHDIACIYSSSIYITSIKNNYKKLKGK